MATSMHFCPSCGKPASAPGTEPAVAHRVPRAKLWKTASFTAIGAAGGYVIWETFFNKSNAPETQWSWNTWLFIVAAIGLIVLFVTSGLSDFEHRLRHGRWSPENYERVRLGGIVLKGQTVVVVVAVAVHLYLSLLLHRPVVAVNWAVQFAIFASVTYAWLDALWHPDTRPRVLGAKAGVRWGFWSALIGSHLSAIILIMSEGLPDAALPITSLSVGQSTPPGINSALAALALGVAVLLATLIVAVVACVSMSLCGYIGGVVFEVFQRKNIKWRLAAAVFTVCVSILCLGILRVFVLRMFPETAGLTQSYDNIFGQSALTFLGSILGIWIAPPLEAQDHTLAAAA